ncbi:MAG: Adaptive-response sensory-kinase SasA [Verrucomicrobiae bacterium]|nr:Adaptive-response sensory-kinase SasA [Verrucomicrobiae bacterium]
MMRTQTKQKGMNAAQLRLLVEGLRGYAVFMLGPDGCIANWNKGAERLLGHVVTEIVGHHFSRLYPREDVERGKPAQALRVAATGGRWEDEGWRVRADGSRFWSLAVVTKLPRGFLAVIQDITERERQEETERHALIGTMSAKFAHEIRNPLSSIKLNVGLVRYEIEALSKDNLAAGNEARSLLQSIDSELRRIQRVTQDYLKFARVSKSRREPVSLNDLLRQKLLFMRPEFEAAGVTVKTDFDETIPPVRLDADQFWQALLNSVVNANEAMSGGGTLTVSTAREGADTVVKIADTGKGMTEEQRRDIFKPFFSTKKTGTGLGLPLTQQIIIENGGRIDCESVLGKGTTFIIRFPQERRR